MFKNFLLITFLIFLSVPAKANSDIEIDREFFDEQNAEIEESIAYSVMKILTEYSDEFVRDMIPKLMESFRPLFILLVSAFLWFELAKMYRSEFDVVSIAKIFGLVVLTSSTMFMAESLFYFQYVYAPISELIISLPAYVVGLASGFGVDGGDALRTMFIDFDYMTSRVNGVADKMSEVAGSGITGMIKKFRISFESFLLRIVFFLLETGFLIIFAIGIFSFYVMMVFLPFGVLFIPFSQTRRIFFNIARATSSYILLPTIASIILSMTLFLMRSVVTRAEELIKTSAEVGMPTETEFGIFAGTASVMGILCLFMLKKSYEFSNQVTAGAVSRNSSAVMSMIGNRAGGAAITAVGAGLVSGGSRAFQGARSVGRSVVNKIR